MPDRNERDYEVIAWKAAAGAAVFMIILSYVAGASRGWKTRGTVTSIGNTIDAGASKIIGSVESSMGNVKNFVTGK